MTVDQNLHRAALAIVGDAAEANSRSEFLSTVLPAVRKFVGLDEISYSEVRLPTWQVGYTTAYPTAPSQLPHVAHVWFTRPLEHPWVAGWLSRGYGGSVRLSDLYSRRGLRRLPYYDEFYRPRGVAHWEYLTLHRTADRVVGLGLGRTARDFTDSEHDLIEALRRPLGGVWAHVQRTAVLNRACADADRLTRRDVTAARLTYSERRVVELLLLGWQNRMIADALAVSTKAIEQHLTHAYRKLAVRSRTELAALLLG